MSKLYYLAYGSNLNHEQMKIRCPQAKPVGSLILQNYSLEFRSYLTIIKNNRGQVPVGIWKISEDDESRLDIYEGYPKFYRKEFLDLTINNNKVKALIYIMNDVRKVAPPDGYYMKTCYDGYRDFGFDYSFLMEAYLKSMI